MKKLNRRGFTLAELLIVVAIIAVLVAVSIPVFTAQLEKSREETDIANLRSAYAIASADALSGTYKKVKSDGTFEKDGDYAQGKTDNVWCAYYSIKQGKLSSSAETGKGTSADGKSEEQNGPLFYKTGTKASGDNLIVVIVENGGVPESVYAGFIASTTTLANVTGTPATDFDLGTAAGGGGGGTPAGGGDGGTPAGG